MALTAKTATNRKTGERVALIGDAWVPITKTATNPKTGERVGLAGNQWVTITPPKVAPKAAEEEFAPSPIEEIPVIGGALSSITDIPLGFGSGLATIGKTFSDVAGADNVVSDALEYLGEGADKLRSAEARRDTAQDIKEMQEAEGFWESAKAAGRAFARHPLDTSANLLGTAAPFVAAAASGVGLPALAALGGASGVGMIKGDIYDAVEARAKQAGMSEEQAKAIAEKAQEYGGENLDMIALGGVIGAVANATGAAPALGKWLGRTAARDVVEQAAARAATQAAGREVTEEAGKGLLRRTAEGAVVEGIPEGIQAGQERLAQNLAQERAGFPTDIGKGVLEQAAYEGTLGAIFGGGVDAMVGGKPKTAADAEEDAEAAFDAAAGGLGDAYAKQHAKYRAKGMSDREAHTMATRDVDALAAAQRRANAAATTDTGGAEPSVSDAGGADTDRLAGDTGPLKRGPVGDGGTAAGADTGSEGTQQPTLKPVTAAQVKATVPVIEKAFEDAAIDFEDTYGVTSLNAEQKKQAARIILQSPEVDPYDAIGAVLDRGLELRGETKQAPKVEPAPAVELTPEAYVDRYLAGEGRGNTPADLELQQYAANFPKEIEAEFARRSAPTVEEAAKAPVADAIKAAAQPDTTSVVPGVAETAAKDLGIAPEETVADTATVENVAPPTLEEVVQEPGYFAASEARQRGLDTGMFGEGVRTVMQGLDVIPDEEILAKQGPEYLTAYKAGMDWINSLRNAPEAEAAPEAAPVEAAPEEEIDAYAELEDEIDSAYTYAIDFGEDPEIDARAHALLKRAVTERKVPLSELRKYFEKAVNDYAERQYNMRYRAGRGAAGMDVGAVESRIADRIKNWRAKVGVKVVGTIDELPPSLRDAVEQDGAQEAAGFVAPDGTIYAVANNMDSMESVDAFIYHEALGHLGLRALFQQKLDAVLQRIYDTNKKLREQADQWLKDNPGIYANAPNPELRALEEVLADQSEAGRVEASVWAKIGAVIKEFGRKIGLKLEYTDAEVRSILAMAHDQIVNGEVQSVVAKGMRYMASGEGDRVRPSSKYMARKRKPIKEPPSVARAKRALDVAETAAQMSGAAGPMFFRSRGSGSQIELLDSQWKALKAATRRNIIGYLFYSRDVIRMVKKMSPAVARKLSRIDELLHRMNGVRNKLLKDLTYNTLRIKKFNAKFKEGGDLLSRLINGSTLLGVDPRHATLAQAIAADKKLAKLVQQGAGARALRNREESIKFVYDMYQKLSDPKMGNGEGQKLYDLMVKGYEKSFDNEHRALVANILSSGLPKDRIQQAVKQLTEMYQKAKENGPYAPLFRSGDFWVRVGKGSKRQTLRFESEANFYQGIKDAISLLRDGGDTRTDEEIMADDTVLNFGRDVETLQAEFLRTEESDVVKKIFETIDSGGVSDAAKIKDMVFQMYTASLPKGTFYEKMQKREGIAGFSADTLRAYVDAQTATANRLAHLKYAREIRRAVGEAQGILSGHPKRLELQPFVDEMAIRVSETFSPNISALDPVARLANKATFFYLLTSVKSMMVQFLQLPTVALPILGARYGYAQTFALAARYISTIGNKLGTTKVDENGNVVTDWGQPTMGDSKYVNEHPDRQMRDALKYAWNDARERGILDTTYTGEMVDQKSGPSEKYQSRPERAGKWVFNFFSGGIHHAERIAREIAYMSAFELDYKKRIKDGIDPKTAQKIAADTAADLTLESMFDYAESSKPRLMKSVLGRIAFQFYSFPIQMISLLTRSFFGAIPGLPAAERKVAAKQFFGIMGMVWMFAGTVGLPGYSFMMGLLTSLRDMFGLSDDDDDDEYNPLAAKNLDLWFRERFLPEYFGPDSSIAKDLGLDEEQAQTLTRAVKMGPISALTNMNVGSSVGLDGLLFRDDTPVDTNEEALRSLAFTLLFGASGSVFRNFARGTQYVQDGDWQRAAESFMPAPIKNVLVSSRLGSEGYISPTTQDVVAPVEEYTWGKLVGQAAGFGRTDVNDMQKSNLIAKKMVTKIEKERSKYMDKLDRAYRDAELGRVSPEKAQENVNAVWEDIDKWNSETGYIHPITFKNVGESLETRAEDRAGSMQGLRVPEQYEPFVRGIVEGNR